MNIRVAAVQMAVKDSKKENLNTMKEQVHICAENGAKIVLLPEMFCCPYDNASFIANKEERGGAVWSALAETAEREHIYLFGGSMPEAVKLPEYISGPSEKLYNTSFVFDPQGTEIARHRKVHLFDIDIKGRQSFRESAVFTHGDAVTLAETEYGKVGLMICFDIRFPELSRLMALRGSQIILVPGAFNATTGPAHWELLFRTRALDNQVFMLGCAPACYGEGYQSYGHSILTTPWGSVKEQLGCEAGTLIADIDLNEVQEIRTQLPVLSARRTDLY